MGSRSDFRDILPVTFMANWRIGTIAIVVLVMAISFILLRYNDDNEIKRMIELCKNLSGSDSCLGQHGAICPSLKDSCLYALAAEKHAPKACDELYAYGYISKDCCYKKAENKPSDGCPTPGDYSYYSR